MDKDLALYFAASAAGKGDADARSFMSKWKEELNAGQRYAANKVEASRGSLKAIADIAKQYQEGDGVGQDKARAAYLIEQLERMGYQKAPPTKSRW